jgi:threonine synthase
MGGLIAKQMGLPVHKFVVATNENDEFPMYCKTGEYSVIAPSRNCISSAMNVGHPSNVARLITLYGGEMDETGKIIKQPAMSRIHNDLFAVAISDEETEATIKMAMEQDNLLLEPHGAVGWAGLMHYLRVYPNEKNRLCVSLETAHPAKFPEKIEEILNIEPELPPSLQNLEGKEEFITPMKYDYQVFSAFLKEHYGQI